LSGATSPATLPEAENFGGRDLANQLIGQVQMAAALSKFSLTVSTSKLAYIKDAKLYKALAVSESADVSTWEGFCTAIGMSRQKVDEDIANLRAFGEDAVESLSRVGAGYRELRQFRRLPEDERAALVAVAQEGDKESFLDMAEALIAKSAKEKETLSAKAAEEREELEAEKKELAEELAAAHRREENLSAEVELQAGKLKRLESKERLTRFLPQTEAVRAECLALQAEAELPINALLKLFESLVETPSHDDEEGLRLGQVFIAAQAVAARAAEMLRALQERVMLTDYAASMPDRVTGEYVMTAEEALRWLADYRLIENRHEAAKALRQTAREEAQPRGRGRPRGAKNKGAEA
jgi:hypothetical protein